MECLPFVVIRAGHGHGKLFTSTMDRVQLHPSQDLLDSGAGLFHTTKLSNFPSSIQTGILPMDRAVPMRARYLHNGSTRRSTGMQRWDAVRHGVTICLRPDDVTRHISLDEMRIDQGNVFIKGVRHLLCI